MTRARAKSKVIAIYVDVSREYACAKAAQVAELARKAGYEIAIAPDQQELHELATGARLEESSLLITIGGDGTLLRGARLAAPHGIPLFGINAGRLGFLTEIDNDGELPDLAALLEPAPYVEERVALQATIGKREFFALNDVVVRKGSASRIVPFTLELDDEDAARIPCDGIAVATPTGSTAYFLSAGGPIIAPDVAAFGIVPLLPHTLFSRPLIVGVNSTIAITAERGGMHAAVETDGEVIAELAPGERVVITKYPKPVKFSRRGPLNFFTRLEKKFNWGKSIRETSG